jgi:adenine/guanine phosphoribosyltransferase-like PRPP-binding protein
VRVFVRREDNSLTALEQFKVKKIREHDAAENSNDTVVTDMLAKELLRCFGNADFDYILDISTDGSYLSTLLSAVSMEKSIVYHADCIKKLKQFEVLFK